MCTNGEVFDWRKPDCFDPKKVIDEIPPPPPENDTAWAPDPECDRSYVLDQIRSRFNEAATGETPVEVLNKIKEKIWWDDETAIQISRLHPAMRDKVVAMLVQMVENPKSLLANAPGPLFCKIYKGGAGGGTRTLEQQVGAWAKGRLPPGTVLPNGLVVPDNICSPGAAGCGIVSNATEAESAHNFGLGVDIYPVARASKSKPGSGQPIKSSAYKIPSTAFQVQANNPAFDLIGAAGTAQGLFWGKNFNSFTDVPHWQLKQHLDFKKMQLQVLNGQTKNGFVIL
jgi:hypothetical protein